MTDINLTDITSGYNVSKINSNFQEIENVVNEQVLHTTGGNNVMGQALDMNGQYILNVATDPLNPQSLLTVGEADLRYLGDYTWGNIIGDLDNQTDLKAALDGKATIAQGLKADSAVQPAEISLVARSGSYTDLANKPLIPSTPADVNAATAEQGAKADSAVQPDDLATVATTGSYNDLTDTPTIAYPVTSVNTLTGAVVLNASDVGAATAAQGAKADTAVQPAALDAKENVLVAGANITIDRTDPLAPIISASGGGTGTGEGDVSGPASSVDSEVVLFNGTTGKLIKGGGALGTAAFTAATDYQAPLVSGTSIKTINGASVLGSGNISTAHTGPYSGVFIEDSLVANVTGTQDLNLTTDGTFDFTLTGDTTFSITNVPALTGQQTIYVVVRLRQGATAYSPTWFSGITWLTSDGLAPAAPAANKIAEYIFTSTDGTSWLGRKGASN